MQLMSLKKRFRKVSEEFEISQSTLMEKSLQEEYGESRCQSVLAWLFTLKSYGKESSTVIN